MTAMTTNQLVDLASDCKIAGTPEQLTEFANAINNPATPEALYELFVQADEYPGTRMPWDELNTAQQAQWANVANGHRATPPPTRTIEWDGSSRVINVLRQLSFCAQTTGGISGADAALIAAINAAEVVLSEPPRALLTDEEIVDLSAMIWGAPLADTDIKVFGYGVRAHEQLIKGGDRPVDPVNGGRYLDVAGAFGEDLEDRHVSFDRTASHNADTAPSLYPSHRARLEAALAHIAPVIKKHGWSNELLDAIDAYKSAVSPDAMRALLAEWDAGVAPFKPTDADFAQWCETHGMHYTTREAFNDATSLYLSGRAV